mmetsp:Transcript_33590/g.100347  ORF Transcript_33590/g.100347 Transcript_33590/m.100347 type:complete len:313 (-) Transcript_33590:1006-1944(-)
MPCQITPRPARPRSRSPPRPRSRSPPRSRPRWRPPARRARRPRGAASAPAEAPLARGSRRAGRGRGGGRPPSTRPPAQRAARRSRSRRSRSRRPPPPPLRRDCAPRRHAAARRGRARTCRRGARLAPSRPSSTLQRRRRRLEGSRKVRGRFAEGSHPPTTATTAPVEGSSSIAAFCRRQGGGPESAGGAAHAIASVSKRETPLVSVCERPPPKKRMDEPRRVAAWHRCSGLGPDGRVAGSATHAHARAWRVVSSSQMSPSSSPPSPGFMFDASVQPPQKKSRPPTSTQVWPKRAHGPAPSGSSSDHPTSSRL